MKHVFLIALMAWGLSATADVTYTWTGAADSSWKNPGNWMLSTGDSGYPNGAGSVVVFEGDANVSLDTGVATSVKNVQVKSGVVTISQGLDGSVLKASYATPSLDELFLVGTASSLTDATKLILEVPVDAGNLRCDKWYGGSIVFRSSFAASTSGIGLLIGDGLKNRIEEDGSISIPNGTLGFGNGTPGTGTQTFEIADRAKVTAGKVDIQMRSGGSQTIVLKQTGEASEVNAGSVNIGANREDNNAVARYELSAGTLSVGTLNCGVADKGRGDFKMSGGTLSIGTISRAKGGTFTYSGGDLLFSGGTLAPLNEMDLEKFPTNIGAPAGKVLNIGSWTHPLNVIGEGAVVLGEDVVTVMTNDVVIGSGSTFKIGSRTQIDAMPGSYEPWKITVCTGGTFALADLTSRLSRPLDLTIESGAKVVFAPGAAAGTYMRSMLVAHKLTVGGVVYGKGRYENNNSTFVLSPGAAIVVPYVWTGAAGDGVWESSDNWEGNVVPPSSAIVDLSAADGHTITITTAAGLNLGGIIANPNGKSRRVTLVGSSLMVQPASSGNCAFYVGKGCELVMDVDITRSSGTYSSYMTVLGGGRLTCRKEFPNAGNAAGWPALVVDATVTLAGENSMKGGVSGTKILSVSGGVEPEGYGKFVIADGASVSADVFMNAFEGFNVGAEVVQEGGTATFGSFRMTRQGANLPVAWPYVYEMKGGALSIDGRLELGTRISATRDRYAGGEFIMTGGSLSASGLMTARNSQWIRLLGGEVVLGADGIAIDPDETHFAVNSKSLIADPIHLGDVTLNATEDWTCSAATVLDRGSSATVLDAGVHAITFDCSVSGPGAAIVRNGDVAFKGSCSFAALTVKNGATVTFASSSSLSGTAIAVEGNGHVIVSGVVGDGLSFDLAAVSSLQLPSGTSVTVRDLSIGGVRQDPGSYSFGSGTVIVASPKPTADMCVYIGANGGNWSVVGNWKDGKVPNGVTDAVDFGCSDLSDDFSINVDTDVTLKSLTFGHPTPGAKLTLSGSGTLRLAGGAVCRIEKGRTLDLASTVVMPSHADGNVEIYGGTLRLSGKLTAAVDIGSMTFANVPFVYMKTGDLYISGEAEGVRVFGDESGAKVVFEKGCIATNRFAVNLPWDAARTQYAEIEQNGGVFGLDATIPGFEEGGVSGGFGFSNTKNGGFAYVLNDGLFRTCPTGTTRMNYGGVGRQTFAFTINGGEAILQNYRWGGGFANCKTDSETITLNDGVLKLVDGLGVPTGTGNLVLNGGEVKTGFSGDLVPSCGKASLTLGGTVKFAQTSSSDAVALGVPPAGCGEVEQSGPGTLTLSASGEGAVSAVAVTGGTLVMPLPTCIDTCTVAKGATLRIEDRRAVTEQTVIDSSGDIVLDFTGRTTVFRLKINGMAVLKGIYGEGTDKPLPPGVSGSGSLQVLRGSGGVVLIVR